MRTSALTLRLDATLQRQLTLLQFEDAHRQLVPFAEARGYLTDEDVFRTLVTKHELVIGAVILTELHRVLKTKFRLQESQLRAVEAALAPYPVVPKPAAPTPIELRDASDRWIIATAVDGGADVLVTGDQDLLSARADAPIAIVDPREFWELLRRGPKD